MMPSIATGRHAKITCCITSIFLIALWTTAILILQWQFLCHSWHMQQPKLHKDFMDTPAMTKLSVPTTLYRSDDLLSILPKVCFVFYDSCSQFDDLCQWHNKSSSHIHLYRLEDDQQFNIRNMQVLMIFKYLEFYNKSQLLAIIFQLCHRKNYVFAKKMVTNILRKYDNL